MKLKNKPATTDIEKHSKIYLTDTNNNVQWIRIVKDITSTCYITEEESIPKNTTNLFKLSVDQYLEYQRHWKSCIKEIK